MLDALPDRGAIVIPGGQFGPHTPLLMYAADAAQARGARLHHVWWTRPEDPLNLSPADYGPWVLEQLASGAVADKWPATKPLLIGKSLGTHAATIAADRQLPAVWLTPLLVSDWVVDALRRATAPVLLVGGTADKLWDGQLARRLSPHVLEVDEADHGMYLPGPLAASAEVLGRVATAVEDFLDGVVWANPTAGRPNTALPHR